MGFSIGERVVEAALLFWRLKLIGIILVSLLFIIHYKRIRRRLEKLYGARYADQSILSVLVSQYYARLVWGTSKGFYSLIVLIFLHLSVLVLLVLHAPVFAAIIYSTLSLGEEAVFLVPAIDFIHENASFIGFVAGASIVPSIVLYYIALFYQRDGREGYLMGILVILATVTGLATRILYGNELVMAAHAVVGYVLMTYLFVSKRGLHWLEALIATLLWSTKESKALVQGSVKY